MHQKTNLNLNPISVSRATNNKIFSCAFKPTSAKFIFLQLLKIIGADIKQVFH